MFSQAWGDNSLGKGRGFAVFLWCAILCFGIWRLNSYTNAAGAASQAPESWPTGSKLTRVAGFPTLVMALHRRCACSSASLVELRRALDRGPGPVRVSLLVYTPREEGNGLSMRRVGLSEEILDLAAWTDSRKPVSVVDADGDDLEQFHSQVSGEVWLYSAIGKLQFHGGITGSRGHQGRNAGADAIVALLSGQSAEVTRTPVFGCSLKDSRQ